MRLTKILRSSVTVIAIWVAPETVIAKSTNVPHYHIVPMRAVLAAGEWVELKLEPPAPTGVQVNWSVRSGASGFGLIPPGIYRAPYSVPVGTPPAEITCSLSGPGVKTSVTADVELESGSVPGSEDCLGPGQSYSTVTADIDSGPFEEGPELIQQATPILPRGAWTGSGEGIVFVHALICRSGRVLAAYVLSRRFEPTDNHPIGYDKQFDEVALTAARGYVFKPAMAGGQAVASWIEIPIIFKP